MLHAVDQFIVAHFIGMLHSFGWGYSSWESSSERMSASECCWMGHIPFAVTLKGWLSKNSISLFTHWSSEERKTGDTEQIGRQLLDTGYSFCGYENDGVRHRFNHDGFRTPWVFGSSSSRYLVKTWNTFKLGALFPLKFRPQASSLGWETLR